MPYPHTRLSHALSYIAHSSEPSPPHFFFLFFFLFFALNCVMTSRRSCSTGLISPSSAYSGRAGGCGAGTVFPIGFGSGTSASKTFMGSASLGRDAASSSFAATMGDAALCGNASGAATHCAVTGDFGTFSGAFSFRSPGVRPGNHHGAVFPRTCSPLESGTQTHGATSSTKVHWACGNLAIPG